MILIFGLFVSGTAYIPAPQWRILFVGIHTKLCAHGLGEEVYLCVAWCMLSTESINMQMSEEDTAPSRVVELRLVPRALTTFVTSADAQTYHTEFEPANEIRLLATLRAQKFDRKYSLPSIHSIQLLKVLETITSSIPFLAIFRIAFNLQMF